MENSEEPSNHIKQAYEIEEQDKTSPYLPVLPILDKDVHQKYNSQA